MRKIYFIRHGRPDFALNESYCLGRSDIALGALGKMQACLLSKALCGKASGGVFSSHLSRAEMTASFLSAAHETEPDLAELYAGEWDGLSFERIKREYSDIYEARGIDRGIRIPGSEDDEDALLRFSAAVQKIIDRTLGDIAIVAHNTVICLFARKNAMHPSDSAKQFHLPYCAWYEDLYDGQHRFDGEVHKADIKMSKEICFALRHSVGMLEKIQKHCDATAEDALRISRALRSCGINLDDSLIEYSALLHDIVRLEKNHEALGGRYLSELGYEDIGNIIRQHAMLDKEEIDEAAVVNIADKETQDTDRVSVEERFKLALSRCKTAEAVKAHNAMEAQALRIKNKINDICGKGTIL